MFSYKFLILCIGFVIASAYEDSSEENSLVPSTRPRYHVDILKVNEDDTLIHLCDGAILGSRYVITAAHCVYDAKNLKELRIRSGSDVAPPAHLPHREKRLFHRVIKIMHPADYVHLPCRSHEHDIAILKVSRSFDLAYDLLYKQVNLPEPTNDYESYNALLSGYNNDNLVTIDSQIISNEECSKNATSIITRGNICSIVGNEADLHNDVSGSPLVHQNTILGIMNSPKKCGAETSIGIKCVDQSPQLKLYTRVSTYLQFIQNVMNRKLSSDIVYRL